MNAPFHNFPLRLFHESIPKHRPDSVPPSGACATQEKDAGGTPCPVASLLEIPLPALDTLPERWWRGAAISAAFHAVVILAVVFGGFCSIASDEPPLEVMGQISLDGFGSPGGSGGDGQAGAGSPAKIAEPAGEQAQADQTPPPPETMAEEPPKPEAVTAEAEPQPILDPQAVKEPKKVEPEPKPKPKPKRKLVQKLHSLVAHTAAAEAAPPKGPITAPNAPENGLGTGTGTGQGDGAGLGPGKGLGHGDGPPGIGGGPGGSGRGLQFGQGNGPRFRHRALPSYPSEAKADNKEGKVTLRLTIDESGILRNVEIMEHTGLEFVEEALRAIKSSTFYPATHEGKAILSRALLTIRFKLS